MGNIFNSLMPIIVGIVIFGILVSVHEFGHFIAARKCGILVEEFAIGMGPKIFSYKPGETLYSLRVFPIGGFCKMLGEETTSDDQRSFNAKTVFQRIVVILAGAAMNILLALLLFIILTFINGYATTTIAELSPNMPAYGAGFQVGDKIVKIDGDRTRTFGDMLFRISQSEGKPVVIEFERNGQKYEKTLTPVVSEFGYRIGVAPQEKAGFFEENPRNLERISFLEGIFQGVLDINTMTKQTVYGIARLVTGKLSTDSIAGPIRITSEISSDLKDSIENKTPVTSIIQGLMSFTALLSVAIGLFNLFPLPALDGGRFVFLLIEAIRKKPVKQETEGMIHFVGFVVLMALAIFIAYNDVMHII